MDVNRAGRAAASVQGGALWIALTGFAMLSVGDGIVKSIGQAWPGTAVAALRYGLAAVGLSIAVALVHGRAGFVCPRPLIQLGRGAAVATATFGFFMGVQLVPLADATAITFTSPMITAVLSALLLKERASRTMWAAILLGFAGVFVVVRPGVGFDPARLLPLLAAFGMSTLILLNRAAARAAPPLVMQFLAAVIATPLLVLAAALASVSGVPSLAVPPPSAAVLLACAAVAVTGTVSHLLIYLATTRASAAAVAPLSYVQLLVAVVIGWAVFGTAPSLATWIGAALIVVGGVLLFRAQPPAAVPAGTPD